MWQRAVRGRKEGSVLPEAQSVSFDTLPLTAIHSQRVLRFDAWWHAARGCRRCPARADFDPTRFTDLLPHFVLVDIGHDPFEVRYRLCGTEIAALDEELTGRRIEDLQHTNPADIAAFKDQYAVACRECRPVYLRGATTSPLTRAPVFYEGGIWPLSSDGTLIDKCAGIQDMSPLRAI
jgi:hypothetical protein